jgi:hypothetical protein
VEADGDVAATRCGLDHLGRKTLAPEEAGQEDGSVHLGSGWIGRVDRGDPDQVLQQTDELGGMGVPLGSGQSC